MQCKKCGNYLGTIEAFCPLCGKTSPLITRELKGKVFIPMDKIIPIGIALALSGLFIEIGGYPLFHRITPLISGIGLAFCAVGFVFLTKYKQAIELARKYISDTGQQITDNGNLNCKYCNKGLHNDSRYCSHCGSKVKA